MEHLLSLNGFEVRADDSALHRVDGTTGEIIPGSVFSVAGGINRHFPKSYERQTVSDQL
jgi:hypothetical protein